MRPDAELLAIASLCGLALAGAGFVAHDLLMTLTGGAAFVSLFYVAERLREIELEERDGE